MIEPGHGIFHGFNRLDGGQRRPAQHDDRQSQRSRRRDLAVCRRAAAVFGDHDLDAMLLEQGAFVRLGERATGGDVDSARHHERRHDYLDATHQITVLRRVRKGCDFLAAEREKDVARHVAECLDGTRRIANLDPVVARDGRPARTAQSKQYNSRSGRGGSCVRGNRGRIRMRCINENIDLLVEEIICQALGAAKTADPHRNRLQRWSARAARERERDRQIGPLGQASGKLPRLRGAAENENSHVAR